MDWVEAYKRILEGRPVQGRVECFTGDAWASYKLSGDGRCIENVTLGSHIDMKVLPGMVWRETPVPVVIAPDVRIDRALQVAFEYGTSDEPRHEIWVIDQMVRALTGCYANLGQGEGEVLSEGYKNFVLRCSCWRVGGLTP